MNLKDVQYVFLHNTINGSNVVMLSTRTRCNIQFVKPSKDVLSKIIELKKNQGKFLF